jgi:hypothetical protein
LQIDFASRQSAKVKKCQAFFEIYCEWVWEMGVADLQIETFSYFIRSDKMFLLSFTLLQNVLLLATNKSLLESNMRKMCNSWDKKWIEVIKIRMIKR